MSTNAHGFLGFLEVFIGFWSLKGDLGEKCTQKCAQNAYEKLANVTICQHLYSFVFICTRLFEKIGVRSQS